MTDPNLPELDLQEELIEIEPEQLDRLEKTLNRLKEKMKDFAYIGIFRNVIETGFSEATKIARELNDSNTKGRN